MFICDMSMYVYVGMCAHAHMHMWRTDVNLMCNFSSISPTLFFEIWPLRTWSSLIQLD